jgi:hypothetical protein
VRYLWSSVFLVLVRVSLALSIFYHIPLGYTRDGCPGRSLPVLPIFCPIDFGAKGTAFIDAATPGDSVLADK